MSRKHQFDSLVAQNLQKKRINLLCACGILYKEVECLGVSVFVSVSRGSTNIQAGEMFVFSRFVSQSCDFGAFGEFFEEKLPSGVNHYKCSTC